MIKYALESLNKNNTQKLSVEERLAEGEKGVGGDRGSKQPGWREVGEGRERRRWGVTDTGNYHWQGILGNVRSFLLVLT